MQKKMTRLEKIATLLLSLIVIGLCMITVLLTVEFILNPAVRLMIIGNMMSNTINQNPGLIITTPETTREWVTIGEHYPTE